MAFKKGDKKPENSGMKKGQTTKKTVWLKESLESVGLSWEVEFKKALSEKDYKLIELLQNLIPYLSPKIKERESSQEDSNEETNQEVKAKSSEDLLKLIKQ